MAKLFLTPCLLLLIGTSTSACAATNQVDAVQDPATNPPGLKSAEVLAQVLADAAPGTWVNTLEPVLAAPPGIERALLTALPTAGAGRQAIIAALGVLGTTASQLPLQNLLSADDPDAAEAALALGRLGNKAAIESLAAVTRDKTRDIHQRTAAAAALLTLGVTDEAVPLLCAVLLAGSPHGHTLMQKHGLPQRPHYALERHITITAIQIRCGQTFGLDPDAPWPVLLEGVRDFCAALSVPVPE